MVASVYAGYIPVLVGEASHYPFFGNFMVRRRRSRVRSVLSDVDPAVDTHDPDMKGIHISMAYFRSFRCLFSSNWTSQNSTSLYIVRFDLESCLYMFLWDAAFHPEGHYTLKSPDSANQCVARLLAVVGSGSSVQVHLCILYRQAFPGAR